jgi:hypothetical protein
MKRDIAFRAKVDESFRSPADVILISAITAFMSGGAVLNPTRDEFFGM